MPAARPSWTWLGPLAGALALLWVNLQLQPWTLDDAYISFRYAENLANGLGPVWNPGERVEGYTTPLWVALLALGHGLGADTGVLAKALGLGFALGTLGLLASAWRWHPSISPTAASVSAAMVGSCGIFAAWAMPGMEVPMVAFLLLLAVLASARDADRGDAWPIAGAAGALALAARPDSVAAVGTLAGLAVLRAARTGEAGALRGPALTAALYGPFFLARWAYYGWPLPNTFYAKVGATEAQVARGLTYVADAAPTLLPFLLPQLALGVLLADRDRRAALTGLGGLWLAALAHVGLVIAVGGDVMPAWRFLAGVVPLLGLGAGVALARVRAAAAVWAALSVGYGLWRLDADGDLGPRIARGVVGRNGEEVGRWLREHAPPDAVIATNTAGSVPYFSGLRAIDMLGLNDAHIAHVEMPNMGARRAGHEKADGAYVLSRRPELVHLGSARGSADPVFRSDRELVRQPGFSEAYVHQVHRLPSGAVLHLWVRRDLAASGRFP